MILVCGLDDVAAASRISNEVLSLVGAEASPWDGVVERASRADAVIMVCRKITDSWGRQLRYFTSQAPAVPLVLVTSPDAHGLALVSDLSLAGVVWLDEVEQRLPTVVAGIHLPSFLMRHAAQFERAVHLPPAVRRAFVYILRAVPPATRVSKLPERALASKSTLHREWASVFGKASGAAVNQDDALRGRRIEDLVKLILLGHAIVLRRHGLSWSGVEERLGVSEKTLRRYVRMIEGLSPGLTEAGDELVFRTHFIDRWVRPAASE